MPAPCSPPGFTATLLQTTEGKEGNTGCTLSCTLSCCAVAVDRGSCSNRTPRTSRDRIHHPLDAGRRRGTADALFSLPGLLSLGIASRACRRQRGRLHHVLARYHERPPAIPVEEELVCRKDANRCVSPLRTRRTPCWITSGHLRTASTSLSLLPRPSTVDTPPHGPLARWSNCAYTCSLDPTLSPYYPGRCVCLGSTALSERQWSPRRASQESMHRVCERFPGTRLCTGRIFPAPASEERGLPTGRLASKFPRLHSCPAYAYTGVCWAWTRSFERAASLGEAGAILRVRGGGSRKSDWTKL
jgi:hypothetical protein